MACKTLTKGFSTDCKESQGGVYTVFLANVSDISSITFSGDTLNISAISMVSGKKFYEIQQEETVANFSANGTKNKQNKSNQFEHMINFNLVKIDEDSIDMVDLMATGKFIAIAYLNTQDYCVLLGWDKKNRLTQKGLEATVNNLVSGTAYTDLSGANITLQGLFTNSGCLVDADLLAGLY